jgi:hypothetical protein
VRISICSFEKSLLGIKISAVFSFSNLFPSFFCLDAKERTKEKIKEGMIAPRILPTHPPERRSG